MRLFDFSLNLILFLNIFVGAAHWTFGITEGFARTHIDSSYPNESEWEVENAPLPDVFQQRFSFLASGGQCYAFVSDDGAYVIKFLKLHRLRVPFWQIPLHCTSEEHKLYMKLKRDFRSYKLALEKLPEETGTLFVHLNRSDNLHKTAVIVDSLGIEHEIDLDSVCFILQRRAEMTFDYLLELVKADHLDLAKEAIDSLFDLILGLGQKGIRDGDAKIHRNYGYIDNKAVVFDIGKLELMPDCTDETRLKRDLRKSIERLKNYLQNISPDLTTYVTEKCENL